MDVLHLNPVGLLAKVFSKPRRPERYGIDPNRDDLSKPVTPSVWEYYKDNIQITRERLEAYRDEVEMDYDDLVSAVLSTVAEDCTQTDMVSGRVVWISSDNRELQKLLMKLLDVLDAEQQCGSVIREATKFGDCFERVHYRRGTGVLGLEYYEPQRVFRVEEKGRLRGYTIDTPMEMHSQSVLYNPWDFIQFSRNIGKLRPGWGYGGSWIEPARRLWRKLQMVEDSIIMYRLKMAPDRWVFYVDVGEASAAESVDIVRMWRKALKKQVLYRPETGSLRVDRSPLAVDDDWFWPTKEGSQSRIEKLAGSSNTMGELHDYEMLVKRLFSVLRAPPSYFGMREEGGALIDNGKTLAMQDARWARGCVGSQRAWTRGVARLCQIHMALKGIDPTDAANQFEVQMAPISYIDEQQRLEVFDLRSRAIDAISRVLSDVDGLDKKRWVSWLLWKFGGLSKGFLDQFIDRNSQAKPITEPLPPEGPNPEEVPQIPGIEGEPLTRTEQESLVEALGPEFLRQLRPFCEFLDGNTRSSATLNELIPSPYQD